MRNKKRNALLPIFFACGMMLSACGGGTPKYTVTWKNYDGNVLEVDENVKKGETPSYDGAAPTKEGDAQYSYAFKGWDPAISEVTADVTYTAQFEQTVKSYTITWANDDGTVIKTDTVEYGQVPNYDGAAPEKQGDAQYTYTFTGWDPTPVAVTGNATYVAQFGQSVNNYTVTWKNADGDTLETDTVQYGDLPKYDGTEPTKAGDETSPMYRFLGWDRNLELPIVGDTVITAQYQNYVKEAVVDDFESYAESAEVLDAGWYAIGWKDGGWSSESGATVSLGTRSEEGQKALRFDAWENGNNYAIVGTIDGTKIGGAVNALKFRLMVPEMNDIRIKVYAKSVMYNGQLTQPWFKYALGKPVSSEYVEYTLSLDDPKWDLWDQHQLNMVTGAQLLGLHQDDIPAMLEKIEIYSSGNDGNGWPYIAFLDSVKFVTELGVVSTQKEAITVYDRYTGVNTLGNTIRIDIGENGAATASVIDLETPQVIPGTYEVDDEHVITFTSADQGATLVYKGRLHNGGKDIKFVSAEGAIAQYIGEMALNAVQVVNDFEQYASDGKAYCQKYGIDQRSGMRGDFYSEYYAGSGSSPWAGSGWTLMGGEGDQAKLKTDGGHTGSKYGCFKNSATYGMRYMQWGLFDGTSDQNSFRGSKLSFWVRTNGKVPAFKFYGWSTNAPKHSMLDPAQKHKVALFEQTAAIGEWTHFEVDLNPNLIYYGFMLFMEKNKSADSYLYLDDVEVYTANPYATYVPEVVDAKLAKGDEFVGKVGGLINAKIRIKDDSNVRIEANGVGLASDGTYTITGNEFTMNFPGILLGYTGELNDELNEMTYKSVSGNNKGYLQNVNFNKVETIENAESYESDGKMYYQGNKDESSISGARGAYLCDYYGGSANDNIKSPIADSKWWLMGGNGDQLKLDKTNAYEGSQSLQIKMSANGAMRYTQWELYKGTAEGHTGVDKFSIFLKNTNAFAMNSVKVRVITAQKLTSNNVGSAFVEKIVNLAANQDWTEVVVDLDSTKTYYGYYIVFGSTANTGYMNVDYAHFYKSTENPAFNFFTAKDVQLQGTINVGAAGFKFGEGNNITFACQNLAMSDVPCTFEMSMTEAGQQMVVTLTSNGAKITGTYKVNMAGVVTFTVTAVDAALATYISVGTVFANAN